MKYFYCSKKSFAK